MNKLTKFRFASVILISDIFVLFCLKGNISAITAGGFLSGILIQAIISVPFALWIKKGKSIENCGNFVKIIFMIYFLLWATAIFSMFWDTSEVIYIPSQNSGIFGKISVLSAIGLVCAYMTSAGMKTLLRSSVIVAGMGAVCILIVMTSALLKSDFENIKIIRSEKFPNEFARGLILSGNLGSFAVLLGNAKGNAVTNSLIYFSAKIIITFIILMTAVLLSGGIMEITDFPVVMSAQLSQPFPSQRIDSLFLMIFSIFGVFSIALQTCLARYLFKSLKRGS
ncbi:MAG: hypothetical protein IKS03_09165 [Ruminococcus sp.]|nr:hypothetical protein [Ruminococcus sp.]